MILLCGLRTDPCLTAVEDELGRRATRVVWFDQYSWNQSRIEVSVTASGLAGTIRIDDVVCDLSAITGIYLRLMDFRKLPDIQAMAPDSDLWQLAQTIHQDLRAFAEVSGARVVSPLRAEGNNFSKPFQTQCLARLGVQVPHTLITNRQEDVHRFIAEHPRAIFKSASAVRSMVQKVDSDALDRLENLRTCPVQFQSLIDGQDVRVHVVGRHVFATAIESPVVDYRYSDARTPAVLTALVLSPELEATILTACRGLGLAVAGVDLKIDDNGTVWWLEANPNPGFSWFEDATGQPIAASIATYLCGEA